jgi:S1-C subfamily serine protease
VSDLKSESASSVSRRLLLAAVLLSACVGLACGAGAAWLVYRASGPAQIAPEIISGGGGKTTTITALANAAESSVVTVVSQPATAAMLASGQVVGNGVVVGSDGLILTSIDTVRGISGGLRIGTGEGNGYDAIIVRADPADGLVLLRAVGAHGLKALSLATASPNPGDAAVIVANPALGGPYVASASVSAVNGGVLTLSAPHRADLIGAPVIDGYGNVIGVVQSPAGAAGEATASGTTTAQAAALAADHDVLSGNALGLTTVLLSTSAAAALQTPAGAFVESVTPGGPAAKSGVEVDDIVTKVNGVAIDGGHPLDPNELHLTAGEQVQLDVVRAGTHLTITLTVGS